MNNLVQVDFVSSAPVVFLSDLRVTASLLVLHAFCAYTDSAFVLELHGDAFLLVVHTLPRVAVDDAADGGPIVGSDE